MVHIGGFRGCFEVSYFDVILLSLIGNISFVFSLLFSYLLLLSSCSFLYLLWRRFDGSIPSHAIIYVV